MAWVVREAVDLYHRDKKAWQEIMKNAMSEDFSWPRSAKQYEEIYGWITGRG